MAVHEYSWMLMHTYDSSGALMRTYESGSLNIHDMSTYVCSRAHLSTHDQTLELMSILDKEKAFDEDHPCQ